MNGVEQVSRDRLPELSRIPKKNLRRLIDEGMVHYEASLAGFAERYRRGETPHTVHVWWARRPHSAMRALVFASLCEDLSDDAEALMGVLSQGVTPPPLFREQSVKCLHRQDNASPKVLDMFGGSGTIAFEAACLGADAFSIDTNELAVFVQRGTLSYCQQIDDLASSIRESGRRVLKQLERDTVDLFPLREKVFGYLWTYSLPCSECNFRFFLSKRPWLSKKAGKRVALRLLANGDRQSAEVAEVASDETFSSPWVGRNGTVKCPRCGSPHTRVSVERCRDELVAMIGNNEGKGKKFYKPATRAVPTSAFMDQLERDTLAAIGHKLPESLLPAWSGIVNPAIYGIETHADFLGRRQRLVLLLLIKALREEYERITESDGEVKGKGVICMLSGLIDQLVDWNCRLSMWISQNEQVGRAFCGPGVPMLWDYVESDPVHSGPANLWKKLDRIVAGSKAIAALKKPVDVRLAAAQELPFSDESFDAIITDPPYYDNIYYNVLADFFYAWKRLLFADIEPDLFDGPQTTAIHELVASTIRSGSPEKAHDDYCKQLARALREAERVLKPEGVFALLYSHSSFGGWEALVRAYRSTSLFITSVQPLSIERKQRPRAMTSEAVNTCIVFVARRLEKAKRRRALSSMYEELKHTTERLYSGLSNAGWHDEDAGVAAYAQGVGMLANVSGLLDGISDLDALEAFDGVVREVIPSFRVVKRKSL